VSKKQASSIVTPEMRDQLVRVYRQAVSSGLPLDSVSQKVGRHLDRLMVTQSVENFDDQVRENRLKKALPIVIRYGSAVLPILFLGVGLYLVGSAVVPIMSYYFEADTRTASTSFTAPIPQDQVMEITPLLIAPNAVMANEQNFASSPVIIDSELDYTNLANWFDSNQLPKINDVQVAPGVNVTQYTLEIPSLEIFNAKVTVGGTDLNSSLIAYPGTANPGQPGAPVIFGHSVLRQYYNPKEKNSRRYNSIFSTIMTLKPGDKIYVTADGVKYTYMVQSKTEVKPQDVHILTQQFDAKRLKLVTCTPEGTYLRRGVVTAQLVDGE
jgi:LPXTG-site transpeptidase (sortase) family protein